LNVADANYPWVRQVATVTGGEIELSSLIFTKS
jgi:hypothetical protein